MTWWKWSISHYCHWSTKIGKLPLLFNSFWPSHSTASPLSEHGQLTSTQIHESSVVSMKNNHCNEPHSQDQFIYLVPTAFIRRWRRFLHNPCPDTVPKYLPSGLDGPRILCPHGKVSPTQIMSFFDSSCASIILPLFFQKNTNQTRNLILILYGELSTWTPSFSRSCTYHLNFAVLVELQRFSSRTITLRYKKYLNSKHYCYFHYSTTTRPTFWLVRAVIYYHLLPLLMQEI